MKTTVILFLLFSVCAIATPDQCVERFNTHYGYVHKVKDLKHPKQDQCYDGLQFKIILDRVDILPILGPNWGNVVDREKIYGSDKYTTFSACKMIDQNAKCWYVTRAQFEILTGKVAVMLDGYGTRMRAIGAQILLED